MSIIVFFFIILVVRLLQKINLRIAVEVSKWCATKVLVLLLQQFVYIYTEAGFTKDPDGLEFKYCKTKSRR